MSVSVDRIRSDIEAIARCTETPGAGATRPTFSPAWGAARAYVVAQAEAAGCEVRTDAAGNVHARPTALGGWDVPAWLVGSHIDTVPHGGDYDGVAGVVVGLELLRSAREDGVDGAAGRTDRLCRGRGTDVRAGDDRQPGVGGGAAGRATGRAAKRGGADVLGSRPSRMAWTRRPAGRRPNPSASAISGFVEVHIEQGPGMWRRDERLAVVRAIAGRRQYRVTLTGEANHAGATAMGDRRDALVGAAEIVVKLETLARELSRDAVATVGRLSVEPNAVNVIPATGRIHDRLSCVERRGLWNVATWTSSDRPSVANRRGLAARADPD